MKTIKYLLKNWNELESKTIKLIEILLIAISVIITLSTISLMIVEIKNNSILIKESINQSRIMTSQLDLNKIAIDNQIKAENISVIFELNKELYNDKNIQILTDIENRTLNNKYTEMEMKIFLDNFEFIYYMKEKGVLDNSDIRVNFQGHLTKVCRNKYLSELAEQYGYGGFNKLCSSFTK